MEQILLPVLLGLFVILLPIGIFYSIALGRKRRKALQQLAAARGWTFKPEKTRALPEEMAGVEIPALRHEFAGDEVWDLLRGSHNGRAFCAFCWKPDFRRATSGYSDRFQEGIVLLQRNQQAAAVPDFAIHRGHAITDAITRLNKLSHRDESTTSFSPLTLPEPLSEWRVSGVEGATQWFTEIDALSLAEELEQAGLSIHTVFGVSGNMFFAHGAPFDAESLLQTLRDVEAFGAIVD